MVGACDQAHGFLLEGSCLEALRAMEPLKEHRELEVAVLAAMLHMHQHSSLADADEIHNLKSRLQIADQNASERALVLAATLYWHLGNSEDLRPSRDLVTSGLQLDSKNIERLRLAIHLTLRSENKPSLASFLLAEFLKSIEQGDPLNAYLCHEVVRSCGKLAGRGSVQVLHRTMAIIEQARRLKPKQPAFAIVLSDQHFFLGDYKSALATYRDVEKTFKLPPFPPI